MIRLLLCSLFFISTAFAGDKHPFYAFENGVRFPSHEKKAATLKELGFDGIGSATLPADGKVVELLEIYQKEGLEVFSFYVGGILDESGHTYPPLLAESIPKLKGSNVVLELYVRGNTKNASDEQAVAFVQEIADLAAKAGIRIVLYPHTGFYVETIGDAVRIAEKCDRPNVGVMFNLCHFLKVEPESDLKATLENAKPFLRQVSVSGATIGGNTWGQLIQPLGEGNYDQAGLLKALNAIEFSGPVGLQCYNIKGEPMDFLKTSISSWNALSKSK